MAVFKVAATWQDWDQAISRDFRDTHTAMSLMYEFVRIPLSKPHALEDVTLLAPKRWKALPGRQMERFLQNDHATIFLATLGLSIVAVSVAAHVSSQGLGLVSPFQSSHWECVQYTRGYLLEQLRSNIMGAMAPYKAVLETGNPWPCIVQDDTGEQKYYHYEYKKGSEAVWVRTVVVGTVVARLQSVVESCVVKGHQQKMVESTQNTTV